MDPACQCGVRSSLVLLEHTPSKDNLDTFAICMFTTTKNMDNWPPSLRKQSKPYGWQRVVCQAFSTPPFSCTYRELSRCVIVLNLFICHSRPKLKEKLKASS